MISTNEFKTGATIVYENNIYQILDFLHVKSARGGAIVKTKLRNLRTGAIVENNFNSGVKFHRAQIDRINMQYLYASGTMHVFMNNNTYEQVEINEDFIKDELSYIVENDTVEIMFYESEILGVNLPDNVVLTVKETVPGVKGDTKTNATKDAVMDTGLLVKVPLFIEEGERLVISTNDGSYVSREK
ncbi:MAG TPA: elongation factor P [Acholeplasmataceae bacterium]|nr:elongation factor P [Acholeplasmataceae bacterium]